MRRAACRVRTHQRSHVVCQCACVDGVSSPYPVTHTIQKKKKTLLNFHTAGWCVDVAMRYQPQLRHSSPAPYRMHARRCPIRTSAPHNQGAVSMLMPTHDTALTYQITQLRAYPGWRSAGQFDSAVRHLRRITTYAHTPINTMGLKLLKTSSCWIPDVYSPSTCIPLVLGANQCVCVCVCVFVRCVVCVCVPACGV